jgi:hypothetical protein
MVGESQPVNKKTNWHPSDLHLQVFLCPKGENTMDEIVEKLVIRLSDADREYFEERAGIRFYDGKILPVEFAEAMALLDILHQNPAALLPSYIEGKFIKKENVDERGINPYS